MTAISSFKAGEHWLAIDYKLSPSDRIYNADPFVVADRKNKKPDAVSAPFDTEMIAPGSSWSLPAGAEFLRERVLMGAATPQGGTPM